MPECTPGSNAMFEAAWKTNQESTYPQLPPGVSIVDTGTDELVMYDHAEVDDEISKPEMPRTIIPDGAVYDIEK